MHSPFLYLPTYFCFRAAAEGGHVMDGLREYRDEGFNVLKACWGVWVPAQFFNFWLVPRNFRILYIAGVGSLWEVILSYLAPLTASVEVVEAGPQTTTAGAAAATGESGESGESAAAAAAATTTTTIPSSDAGATTTGGLAGAASTLFSGVGGDGADGEGGPEYPEGDSLDVLPLSPVSRHKTNRRRKTSKSNMAKQAPAAAEKKGA